MSKLKKKKFFMNFSNIFMWVIVGENTFLGSVLDTISWSDNSCGKKAPSFWTSHKFTHVLKELLTFSRYFRTFGQHVLTKIFMWKKSPNLPLHNANFEIFISCMVPEIFAFSCTDTPRPDLKITTFIYYPSSGMSQSYQLKVVISEGFQHPCVRYRLFWNPFRS